jgi:hypothetical protein
MQRYWTGMTVNTTAFPATAQFSVYCRPGQSFSVPGCPQQEIRLGETTETEEKYFSNPDDFKTGVKSESFSK